MNLFWPSFTLPHLSLAPISFIFPFIFVSSWYFRFPDFASCFYSLGRTASFQFCSNPNGILGLSWFLILFLLDFPASLRPPLLSLSPHPRCLCHPKLPHVDLPKFILLGFHLFLVLSLFFVHFSPFPGFAFYFNSLCRTVSFQFCSNPNGILGLSWFLILFLLDFPAFLRSPLLSLSRHPRCLCHPKLPHVNLTKFI